MANVMPRQLSNFVHYPGHFLFKSDGSEKLRISLIAENWVLTSNEKFRTEVESMQRSVRHEIGLKENFLAIQVTILSLIGHEFFQKFSVLISTNHFAD